MSESDTQRQTHRRELWYEWLDYKDMLASYEQCTGQGDCEMWLRMACDTTPAAPVAIDNELVVLRADALMQQRDEWDRFTAAQAAPPITARP